MKDNLKNIKLPVNNKNNANVNGTKALENAMNEVLKERRTQQNNTTRTNTTTSTSKRTTTQQTPPPKK